MKTPKNKGHFNNIDEDKASINSLSSRFSKAIYIVKQTKLRNGIAHKSKYSNAFIKSKRKLTKSFRPINDIKFKYKSKFKSKSKKETLLSVLPIVKAPLIVSEEVQSVKIDINIEGLQNLNWKSNFNYLDNMSIITPCSSPIGFK